MTVLFWILLTIIVYTYFGYPFIISVLATLIPGTLHRDYGYTPSVSVIISAFNEEQYIERKIIDLLAQNYPPGKIEILIGSDGSTDATEEIVRNYAGKVQLFPLGKRQGKPGVLNRLAAKAAGEIIVFADARQKFHADAVRELVADFADERVGCVSGELFLEGGETSPVGTSLGIYWKYEKLMRSWESGIDSMIGATGAIYAIRASLFMPIPEDTILDDMLIPLEIARRGYRCLFEPRAMAYDRVAQTPADESRRKVRTLAGNVQLFYRHMSLLNPFSNRIAWQLISHKLLRIKAPYFLILLFMINAHIAVIDGGVGYRFFFLAQAAFYLLALAGNIFVDIKTPYLSIPRTFCQLNLDAIRGACSFFSGTFKITWKK